MLYGQKILRFAPCAVTALFLTVAFNAHGQLANMPKELEEGLRYVTGLQGWYFNDIADQVLEELTAKFPQAKTEAAALKLKGELLRGKFDDVIKRIGQEEGRIGKDKAKTSPELWAMKLALADAYFAYGKNAEVKGIYSSFFDAFKDKQVPASLEGMWVDAAYKYAQMLLHLKEYAPALVAYNNLLSKEKLLPDHVRRQCYAEKGEIALSVAESTQKADEKKKLCTEVSAVADKLLWVRDLWFGKAIVLKAHALMLMDKTPEAKKLVDDYMGTLNSIHQELVRQEAETGEQLVRISPMAECRYLIAVLLKDKAQALMDDPSFSPSNAEKKEAVLSLLLGERKDGKRKGDGAYNHFLNVYLRYPESNWAADAGEMAEFIRSEWLEGKFGGTVKSSVTPEQTAKVREIQFRDARMLFAQGQIDAAIVRLTAVLNQFPDCPEALPALYDLARCYMQKTAEDPDADLYCDIVIGHLAERFYLNKNLMVSAGDNIIRLAEYWLELGRPDKRKQVYEYFFKYYALHPSSPMYLAQFGEQAYKDKSYGDALHYFGIVANSYTNSPRAFDALNRICTVYEEMGDLTNAITAATAYVARLKTLEKPTQELMAAMYREADSHRRYAQSVVRSGTTNETELAAAEKELNAAAVSFIKLSTALKNPPPSTQTNADQEKKNKQLRQSALFNSAYCLSQLTKPEKNIISFRKKAIETYESIVSEYPDSDVAPTALIQVGALWTMMKDSDPDALKNAETALTKLRKNYPGSEQARSALPLMADTLMRLGMREEAVSRYREMFTGATASQYGDNDILRAARALVSAKEYNLAKQGVDRVLLSKDPAILPQARYLEAELLFGMQDYKTSVEKLKSFEKDYGNFSLVTDARLLLSKAASIAGETEKDKSKRFDYFNDAIKAMKEVQKRRTNNVDRATADIEVGRILAREARAEEKFGTEASARDYFGKAIISYQAFIDSVNPRNTELLPLVEIACMESIPLLQDAKKPEYVVDTCDEYLRLFPNGKHKAQIEAWKSNALTDLSLKK